MQIVRFHPDTMNWKLRTGQPSMLCYNEVSVMQMFDNTGPGKAG